MTYTLLRFRAPSGGSGCAPLLHPAAFLVFAFMGIPLALLGIVIYLYSLVSLRSLANRNDPVAISAKTVGKSLAELT